MSFKKRLGVALGFMIVPVVMFMLWPSQKAHAATITKPTWENAKYTVASFSNGKPETVVVTGLGDGKSYGFLDCDTTDGNVNLKYYGNGRCGNGNSSSGPVCAMDQNAANVGITLATSAATDSSGTQYYLANVSVGSSKDTASDCTEGHPQLTSIISNVHAAVDSSATGNPAAAAGAASAGGASAGATGSDAAADPATNPTCESSSSTALEWIMCPIFNIGTTLSEKLISLFTGQLCFTTTAGATGAATNCAAFDSKSIQPAWSGLKNIASALIVIIMLIAIVSQAFSIGGVDAYTIRKLLPRIIGAVILIQLSFYIFSFIINAVNDVGSGLSDLLAAAFPANSGIAISDPNAFYELLQHAGVQGATAIAVNWVGLITFVALAVAALPMLLMVIFVAVVSLVVGLAVLIFRKVLIIALLLTAPVALIAWILPGTERYWKLWFDNFMKVLFMFPIIVLILEAGRIFAYSAGAAGDSQFIKLFLVMVSFFGVLFILPKAYRWGGGLMTAAGSTISGMSKPISEKGGAGIRGYGEREWQQKGAAKYNPEASRWSRGFRRLQSGHVLPTSRSQRLAIATGDEYSKARNDEAAAYAGRIYNQALTDKEGRFAYDENGNEVLDEDGNKKKLKGVSAAKQALVELAHNKDERVAKGAIRQLIDTGSWPEIQSARDSQGRRAFEKNPSWLAALEQSPEHYRSVLGSRADLAPHIIENNPTRSAQMTTTILKQLNNEDFGSQSQGFWEEAAALANPERKPSMSDAEFTALKAQGQEVQNALRQRFDALQDSGMVGQQVLGRLRGGSAEQYVNAALGKDAGGNPLTVGSYLSSRPPAGAGPSAPRPGSTPLPDDPTTVRVDHGPRPSPPTSGWSAPPEYPPAPLEPENR